MAWFWTLIALLLTKQRYYYARGSSPDEERFDVTEFASRFRATFRESCSQYAFVRTFQQIASKKRDFRSKFLVYTLQSNSTELGGFGDRVTGLITAVLISLRLGRILIVDSDNESNVLFNPGTSEWIAPYTYHGWKAAFGFDNSSSVKHIPCMHTSSIECALLKDSEEKYLFYSSNRAQLCQLLRISFPPSNEAELKDLGIEKTSNLYQVAGCLLRLALWPSDQLWHAIFTRYPSYSAETHPRPFQVSSHFRCGDASYLGTTSTRAACGRVSLALQHTGFATPANMAACVSELIAAHERRSHNSMASPILETNSSNNVTAALVFIESDSQVAAEKIVSLIDDSTASSSRYLYLARERECHVAMDTSFSCFQSTVLSWFALSQSDHLVVQSPSSANMIPASAFSRTAAMYGLKKDSLRSVLRCGIPLDWKAMGDRQYANWLC